MNIGKYAVDAHASGSQQDGFKGSVMRTWNEGGETKQLWHQFDKTFPTMEEAIAHAYEQAHLRVRDGVW
jgi:hypothetical protein